MEITEFISRMPAERQVILQTHHEAILANDPTVKPVIKPMMGKEMILYEERGYMKYGLASVVNYMSLHCMPIYMNPELHIKYAGLLPLARFQKGCINFTDIEAMPLAVLTDLIVDCSAISVAAILESRKRRN